MVALAEVRVLEVHPVMAARATATQSRASGRRRFEPGTLPIAVKHLSRSDVHSLGIPFPGRARFTLAGWSAPAGRDHTYPMDPFAPLRRFGHRVAPQAEERAQAAVGRAVELVASAVDVNAVADRVDLNAVLDHIDVDAVLDRVDLNAVLSRLDVGALLDRIDLNRLLARVDVNRLAASVDVVALVQRVDVNEVAQQVDVNEMAQQVDVDGVIRKVDLDAVVNRVDLNDVVQRIDIEALVEHTDIGAIIARSSSGVASDVLDVVRGKTVGVDEFIARWVARLRRRPYTGPPGPVGAPHAGGRQPDEPPRPDERKATAES